LPCELCPGRRVGFARGLEWTKPLAESNLPLVVKALAAKHQHGLRLKSREDLGDRSRLIFAGARQERIANGPTLEPIRGASRQRIRLAGIAGKGQIADRAGGHPGNVGSNRNAI